MAGYYDAYATAKPKAFQILPVELNQHIANYLDDDKDIVHLRASCHAAKDAIDDDDSFWFTRFHQRYDPSQCLKPDESKYKSKLKGVYQLRSKWLRKMAVFRVGATNNEKICLTMLSDLMEDSFGGKTFTDGEDYHLTCLNLQVIKKFAKNSNLLDSIFRPTVMKDKNGNDVKYSQKLAAVQLMCTPWCFKWDTSIFGFDVSQKAAYSTIKNAPIFGGLNNQQINMEWVLHIMNFFKFHIMKPEEITLFDPFHTLPREEKPLPWQSQLKNGPQKLSKHWKGTYAYLDREEMKIIRSNNPAAQTVVLVDHNVDHGDRAIQTLNLDFPEKPAFKWPQLFEHHLKSLVKPDQAPRTRAQHRSDPGPSSMEEPVNFRFQASGYDDESFHAAGWINPLPLQEGISGWKRVTMMKYFDNGFGGWDENALWAYEGVVLPGGKIMLGRWWSPEQETPARETYTGPFIFWDIEGPRLPDSGSMDAESSDSEFP